MFTLDNIDLSVKKFEQIFSKYEQMLLEIEKRLFECEGGNKCVGSE